MEALHREIVRLDADAWIEANVGADGAYRLSLWRAGKPLVEYWSDGSHHRKRLSERTAAYVFRSIEQVRYDFERDAEDALGRN